MRSILFAVLCGVLLGGGLLAPPIPSVPQDPPLPDAVEFCAIEHKQDNGKCSCTNPDAGGNACVLNDNNRPRMCKWQCGHAKSCACCAS